MSIEAPNTVAFGAMLTGVLDPAPLPRFFFSKGLVEASFVRVGAGQYEIRLADDTQLGTISTQVNGTTENGLIVTAFIEPTTLDPSDPQMIVNIETKDDAGANADADLLWLTGITFATGESPSFFDFF